MSWTRQDKFFKAVRKKDGRMFEAIRDVNGDFHILNGKDELKFVKQTTFLRTYANPRDMTDLMEQGHG